MGAEGAVAGPGAYLESADVAPQPTDGSCLYHSLMHGVGESGVLAARSDATRFGCSTWLPRHGCRALCVAAPSVAAYCPLKLTPCLSHC